MNLITKIFPPPPPTSPTINLTLEYLAYVCDLEKNTLKQPYQWTKKRKGEPKCEVHGHLMLTVVQYALDKGWNKPFKLKCYTYCELMLHTRKERFRATTSYLCGKWFDWCLFNHGTEREGEYESYAGIILVFQSWRRLGSLQIPTNVTLSS